MGPPTPNSMPPRIARRDNLEATQDSLRLFTKVADIDPDMQRADVRNARYTAHTIWIMINSALMRPDGPDARHIHISREVAFVLFKGGLLTADSFRYPSSKANPYVQCKGLYVRAVLVLHGRELLCDIYETLEPGICILDSRMSSNGTGY